MASVGFNTDSDWRAICITKLTTLLTNTKTRKQREIYRNQIKTLQEMIDLDKTITSKSANQIQQYINFYTQLQNNNTLFVDLPEVKIQITQYIQKLTKLKKEKNGLLLKYVNTTDHANGRQVFSEMKPKGKKKLQQTTLRL